MASRGKGVPRGGAKFGIQKPLENSNKIHDSILKQARQSGQLNLSGRNLTEGDLNQRIISLVSLCSFLSNPYLYPKVLLTQW